MKSLEYCLDYILEELKNNWDGAANERRSMVVEVILSQFGLPNNYRKHEFFIRLIDRLVKDGYAEFIIDYANDPTSKIQFYQEKTIITIEGFYFLTEEKGYKRQKINERFEADRVRNIEIYQSSLSEKLNVVTGWIAFGTVALVLVDLLTVLLEHLPLMFVLVFYLITNSLVF